MARTHPAIRRFPFPRTPTYVLRSRGRGDHHSCHDVNCCGFRLTALRLERALNRSWARVVSRAKRDGVSNRTAAMAIGVERVVKAKQMRGLFP